MYYRAIPPVRGPSSGRSTPSRGELPMPAWPFFAVWPTPNYPVAFKRAYERPLEGNGRALAAAAIPVEKIGGPVLLVSGEEDQIWPAARLSEMVVGHLRANRHPFAYEHLRYEGAGHMILPPGLGRFSTPPFLEMAVGQADRHQPKPGTQSLAFLDGTSRRQAAKCSGKDECRKLMLTAKPSKTAQRKGASTIFAGGSAFPLGDRSSSAFVLYTEHALHLVGESSNRPPGLLVPSICSGRCSPSPRCNQTRPRSRSWRDLWALAKIPHGPQRSRCSSRAVGGDGLDSRGT